VEVLAGEFASNPPPDSRTTPYELPIPRPFGAPEIPVPPGVAAPNLQKKQDPNYDEDSRKAGVEGTVLLYLIVDTAGLPSDIAVFRCLNAGLDAEAVQAMSNGASSLP
jgi:outer membrane biosynthesis protein TonB